MTFKTLSSLLASHQSIAEEALDTMGGGIGTKPHPVLSRAELVRFSDKIDQANLKVDELRSIFKEAPGASGPAHKLHHIGSKAGFDMHMLDEVNEAIEDLQEALDELHMAWGTRVQTDTGMDDEEAAPAPEADDEEEADADDLPSEDEAK